MRGGDCIVMKMREVIRWEWKYRLMWRMSRVLKQEG